MGPAAKDSLALRKSDAHYNMDELRPLLDAGEAQLFHGETVHQLLEALQRFALGRCVSTSVRQIFQ